MLISVKLGMMQRDKLMFNEKITITQMTAEDIPDIAQLEKDNFSLPWSEKSLEEELTNNLARFFVAKVGSVVIGYIGAFNVVGEVSITNIVVNKDYRNNGIGNLLLKHLENISVNEKAEFITLEVRKSNKIAIKLYQNNNYEAVGERKNFYEKPTEDAILMTKYF